MVVLTWLLLPLLLLYHRLLKAKLPSGIGILSLAWVVFIYVFANFMTPLICLLSGVDFVHGIRLEVSAWAALLTYLWPLSVFALSYMLFHLDRRLLSKG